MRYIGIGEAARDLGVTEQTLRNWDNAGRFKPHHTTPGGHRFYSEDQIQAMLGITRDKTEPDQLVVGYCRVSSYKQRDDLDRQVDNVKTYCIARGYQFDIIKDIGSGINYRKKGLSKLIEMVMDKRVSKIVVLYKDRLLRFGYELLEDICKAYGTTIEIIDNTEKTDEQELVEDLVQIITAFSSRLHGRRARKTKGLLQAVINMENTEDE